MRKHWHLALGLILLLAACGSLLVPSIRWPVYGWLRGEAFYQGRPTSYWSREVARMEQAGWLDPVDHVDWSGFTGNSPSWWERLLPQNFADLRVLEAEPAAIPVLKDLSTDSNAYVRWVAVYRVSKHVQDDDAVIPIMTYALADPDLNVRLAGAFRLANLDSTDGQAVIPVLLEGLQQGVPWLRFASVTALAALGPRAKSAIPGLLIARDDPTAIDSWQSHVDSALKAIDPEAAAKAGVK